MSVVNQTRRELMAPVKVRQSSFTLLVKRIEGHRESRHVGLRELTCVECSRERVPSLELKAIRKTAIGLENQRVVLRGDVTANFLDQSEPRVGTRGAEEIRYGPGLASIRTVGDLVRAGYGVWRQV